MGWFKIPFLGEVETMIKSQFGDLWPGTVNSIWGLSSYFQQRKTKHLHSFEIGNDFLNRTQKM